MSEFRRASKNLNIVVRPTPTGVWLLVQAALPGDDSHAQPNFQGRVTSAA